MAVSLWHKVRSTSCTMWYNTSRAVFKNRKTNLLMINGLYVTGIRSCCLGNASSSWTELFFINTYHICSISKWKLHFCGQTTLHKSVVGNRFSLHRTENGSEFVGIHFWTPVILNLRKKKSETCTIFILFATNFLDKCPFKVQCQTLSDLNWNFSKHFASVSICDNVGFFVSLYFRYRNRFWKS